MDTKEIIRMIDLELSTFSSDCPPRHLSLLSLLEYIKENVQSVVDTAELYAKDNHQLEIDLAIAQAEAQDSEKHIVVLENIIKKGEQP